MPPVPNPDEARYRTLVRAISQIVWTTPPTGEFAEVDPAWTEYTGQTMDEAIGWGWLDAVHPDDRVRVRQLWKRALDTKSFYHIEHRLRRRDGMHRWVAARAAPVFAGDGTVREWVGTYSDVDEMRRASEERARLFQAERRARADAERLSEQLTDTIESIAEPFVEFDREWRILRMNGATRRVLRSLGIEGDAAMGRVFWELFPELEHERIGDELKRAARERQASQFIYEFAPTGRWLEVHAYPTRDGMATYALDVSERVRAEETLRFLADASRILGSSLDYAQTLQTVAQLAVPFLADYCIVDLIEEDGSVRRLATAHVDPSKQPLLEEIKEYPPILDSNNFVAAVLRTGRSELAPDTSNLDVSISSAGRSELMRIVHALGPKSYLCVPLIVNDRVLGSILCVSTNEKRRYGESELAVAEELGRRAAVAVEHARLFQREQEARAEAEKANRAKMDFLAMMSYELRTPLNAIAGYAELLELGLRGPVTDQQVKDLQSIHRNERHLLALIEEVLAYAKLDAGRVELDVHDVRVQPAIESVTSIVAPQMSEKGIAFELDEIDPSLVVYADLEKLQQIIGNLLSNAIKFTDRGGRISVGANATGREVTVRVRDTGVGIPREQQSRVFEPFVRLDGGLTRRSSGTGLGLAVSRELARAMRGELSVTSELGQGAEFVLKLPRATK